MTCGAGFVSTVTDAGGHYSLIVPAGTGRILKATIGTSSLSASVDVTPDPTIVKDFPLTHTPVTYWVSTAGSDSNNGLSPTTAWQHIDHGDCMGLLLPGDTVRVKGGVYVPRTGNNANLIEYCFGTPGKPITYANVAGESVSISFPGSDWSSAGFQLGGGVHDIVIGGFAISGCPTGILSGLNGGDPYISANIEVKNCEFSGHTVAGILL